MEEQENSSTETSNEVVVEERQVVKRGPYKKAKPKTTFLKPKGHDLDKAIKQSGRYLETALRTLVEISVDSNKEFDPKERRQAADSILKLHKDMVGQRDKDEIERLTKEIELLKLVGQGSTDDEEEDDTPQLDFDHIHPDFAEDGNDVQDVEFEEKS